MGAATLPPVDIHAVVLSFSFTLPFSGISRSLPLRNIDKTYHCSRRCRCSGGGMPFPPEAFFFLSLSLSFSLALAKGHIPLACLVFVVATSPLTSLESSPTVEIPLYRPPYAAVISKASERESEKDE